MSTAASPSRPPRALAAITEDSTLGAAAACTPEAGQLLRCLAASRLRGVTLQMGAASVALAAWIVDGMDITSRLLLLVDTDERVEPARRHICNDIRVAVHCQPAVQFMREVSRNQVDLVVVDDARAEVDLLDAAVDLLNPGGMLCLLDAAGGSPDLAAAASHLHGRLDCLLTLLPAPLPVLMAVRTPADSRPIRRGGRGARRAEGRTPVPNLR